MQDSADRIGRAAKRARQSNAAIRIPITDNLITLTHIGIILLSYRITFSAPRNSPSKSAASAASFATACSIAFSAATR